MKLNSIVIGMVMLGLAYACSQEAPLDNQSTNFSQANIHSLSDSMLISIDTAATEVLVAGVAGKSALTVHYKAPKWENQGMPFGQVIPFDAHWTPSEEIPCILNLEKPIYFNDQLLAEGDYFLYIMPSENEWEIFLTSIASPELTISFKRPVEKLDDLQQRLIIAIKRVSNSHSEFSIAWHHRKVSFHIEEART